MLMFLDGIDVEQHLDCYLEDRYMIMCVKSSAIYSSSSQPNGPSSLPLCIGLFFDCVLFYPW